MESDIQQLVDDYLKWLRDKTVLRRVNDAWVEITTPYLDRHNDCLQIYARRDNGGFQLSDDAYTITDLEQSGCHLDTPKRQALLNLSLAGFGVNLEGKELTVHAGKSDFALRKHNLVQAMLAVNDLFAMATPLVASLFFENVVTWLDAHDVRYVQKAKFTGTSGFDHLFDFVIPKSRAKPERFLQTITRPSRETAESAAFKWIDTREVRDANSVAYALLNDTDQHISEAVIEALRSYDLIAIPWSQRAEYEDDLAA